jgi:hypothetical protein
MSGQADPAPTASFIVNRSSFFDIGRADPAPTVRVNR